jgi:aspartate-semialdehyde dehydrogenase
LPAKPLSIALIGGDEPLAEAVLRLLEEREIETGRLFPLAEDQPDASITYRGEEIPLLDAAGFDWKSADLAILASRGSGARRHVDVAAKAGLPVLGVDDPAWQGRHPDLPFASGPAVAVSRIAALLARQAGLAAIHASLNLPMSQFGKAGIEELSNQARALFSLEPVEADVLPPRIAFNLVPQAAESRQLAASQYERGIEASVRHLLDRETLPVLAFACWVPVFYGHSAVLHVTTETDLDIDALRSLFGQAAGVTLMDEPLPGGVPTPATDALDSEDIFVGRVRVNAGDVRQLSLWLVFDGLRLEAAQIAASLENLIEKNQKSVLT